MKNWRKKDIIKNSLRILGFVCFMIYVGAFSTGMGHRAHGEGCASYLFRQIMGVPILDDPEQTQDEHDRILEYMETSENTEVSWVNRGGVRELDGNTFHGYGLG